jgi:hypothetical protein
MKQLILIALVIFASCKKEADTPQPAPKVQKLVTVQAFRAASLQVNKRIELYETPITDLYYVGDTLNIVVDALGRETIRLEITQDGETITRGGNWVLRHTYIVK